MSQSTATPSLAVFITGIGKAEFSAWRPLLRELVESPEILLLQDGPALSAEDESFLEDVDLPKAPLAFSDADSPTIPKAVLFLDTPEHLKVPDALSSATTACLFGGLGAPDYTAQIRAARKLNLDKLFCDALSVELDQVLDREDFAFLTPRQLFLPPAYSENSETVRRQRETTLVIHLDDPVNPHSTPSKTFFKAFDGVESVRLEMLTEHPIEQWLERCAPGKDCRTIAISAPSLPLQHYVAGLCAAHGIVFHPLDSRGATSPSRAFLPEGSRLTNWLRHAAPMRSPSLRETFKSLLLPPDAKEDASAAKTTPPPFTWRNFSQPLLDDGSGHEGADAILTTFRNHHASPPFSSEHGTRPHYLSSPFAHLCQDAPLPAAFRSSLQLFTDHAAEDPRPEAITDLMGACLRLAANLPHDQALLHVLRKLTNLHPNAFLSAFESNFLSAPTSGANIALAGGVQTMLQIASFEEDVRRLCFERLNKISFPPPIATRLFLGAGELDLFRQALAVGRNNGNRGLAGTAARYTLLHSPALSQEELGALETLCEEEISANSDSSATHWCLAMTRTLGDRATDAASTLANPEKTMHDLRRFPFVWHELALLALAKDNREEAAAFLESPSEPDGGGTAYGRLAAIGLRILLGQDDAAAQLAAAFPEKLFDTAWNGNTPPYFSALYHAVIFHRSGLEDSATKALGLMEEALVPQDALFRPMLEAIEPVPSSALSALAATLVGNLPPVPQ